MSDTSSYGTEKHINDPEKFWLIADNLQDKALIECDELFFYLRDASLKNLQNFLIQYRYFTVYYIADLALLIARLDDGVIRSFLSDILYDELGCGNHEKSHPELYDNFLKSIGVAQENMNKCALKNNIKLLDNARKNLVNSENSSQYGVGLRGMGGECICQVYIEKLYGHLIENPYIKKNKNDIDWAFWNIHIGEHDIVHRKKTRSLIDSEIVKNGGQGLRDLAQGYLYSVSQWKAFWMNIYSPKEHGKIIDINNDIYTKISSAVDFSVF